MKYKLTQKRIDNLNYSFAAFMRRNPQFKTHKEIIQYYYPKKITSIYKLALFIGCSPCALLLYLTYLGIPKQKKGWPEAKLKNTLYCRLKALGSVKNLTAKEIANLLYNNPTEPQIVRLREMMRVCGIVYKKQQGLNYPEIVRKAAHPELTQMEIKARTNLSAFAVRKYLKKLNLPYANFKETYRPIMIPGKGVVEWKRIKPMPQLDK
jgi:hypothetical protein